jgi:hypothetical protein
MNTPDFGQCADDYLDGDLDVAAWSALVAEHGEAPRHALQQAQARRAAVAALPRPGLPPALRTTILTAARTAAAQTERDSNRSTTAAAPPARVTPLPRRWRWQGPTLLAASLLLAIAIAQQFQGLPVANGGAEVASAPKPSPLPETTPPTIRSTAAADPLSPSAPVAARAAAEDAAPPKPPKGISAPKPTEKPISEQRPQPLAGAPTPGVLPLMPIAAPTPAAQPAADLAAEAEANLATDVAGGPPQARSTGFNTAGEGRVTGDAAPMSVTAPTAPQAAHKGRQPASDVLLELGGPSAPRVTLALVPSLAAPTNSRALVGERRATVVQPPPELLLTLLAAPGASAALPANRLSAEWLDAGAVLLRTDRLNQPALIAGPASAAAWRAPLSLPRAPSTAVLLRLTMPGAEPLLVPLPLPAATATTEP